MTYGNLVLILAPMGGGKTTLIRRLVRRIQSPVLVADPGNEIGVVRPNVQYHVEILDAAAPKKIALRFLDFPPGAWLVLDDADSYLSVAAAAGNPLLLLLSHLKQLRANALLAAKLPQRLPTVLRSSATRYYYAAFGEPNADRWIVEAGLPDATNLPRGHLLCYDRRSRCAEIVTLDFGLE